MIEWLALIFLTLTGYSAGAVLSDRIKPGRPRANLAPSLSDTMLVALLWIGGVALRLAGTGAWTAAFLCSIVAVVLSFVTVRVQSRRDEGKPLPQ